MTTTSRHNCTLPLKKPTGLPRLAPNAHWSKILMRQLRTWFLVNPKHSMCKKLFRNNAAIVRERVRHASGPHYFIIHPLSTVNMLMEVLFVIVWSYIIIMEPIVAYMPSSETVKFIMELHRFYLTPIQGIFILLFFITGYVDQVTNCIVLEPKKIIRKYLLSFFIFDVFSTCLPVDIPGVIFFGKGDESKPYVLYGYLVRMSVINVRIPTILRFMNSTLKQLNLGKITRAMLCYVVQTYLILHVYCFIIIAIPFIAYRVYEVKIEKSSWIKQTIFRHQKTSERYFYVLRMVFCFFFGVPSRYMNPLCEQIPAVLISFTGRLYTLYMLADILRFLGIASISESLYQGRLRLILNYLADKTLPDSLRQRMLGYCEFKFQGRYFHEENIRNSLSDNLRAELFMFTARKLVQKVGVFKNLPPAAMADIMEVIRSDIYSPRDVIISIGSEINDIFFISSGTVAITTSEGKELCHLEDGDEFGTNCLFVKHHQMHAVVAVETTEAFIIDKDKMIKFLSPYPDVKDGFFRSAKERLARFNYLEDRLIAKNIDILAELDRGHILEKPTKRERVTL